VRLWSLLTTLVSYWLLWLLISTDNGRSEEITGTVVAEIDVPTSNARVLASLDIIGVVGTAKLHVPKNIAVI
jgi:hypothetical protein